MYQVNKHYEKNEQGRDFVIGDLHGCYGDFMDALDIMGFDKKKDRMFSVGDLVDRGESSMSCLRLLKEPWFHAVRGNHEDLMICALLDGNRADIWWYNGGKWADDPMVDVDELRDLTAIAAELPLAITIETSYGKVGMCHAEPPKDWDEIGNGMSREKRNTLIWGRKKIMHSRNEMQHVKNIDFTIHGHTPVCTPVAVGNSIYIDTGCVFRGTELANGRVLDGYLTCFMLEDIPAIYPDLVWPVVRKELKKQGKELFD